MKYLYVCIFAFIGGALRYEISMLVDIGGTLAVNLAGAFILGLLSVKLMALDQNLRTGITAGFVGSFTTFSTFSKESIELLQTTVWSGIGYIAVTIIFGVLLAYAGMKVGEVTQ
ncbi:fluoride efflux transporter FluC [Macrococcus equipercicus]|nr:CrcB family protein [Macrococcus equipercicus]UTH13258.1 CrcB family protein [Macrococcus equipercicus]